jgi:hypothetical protein
MPEPHLNIRQLKAQNPNWYRVVMDAQGMLSDETLAQANGAWKDHFNKPGLMLAARDNLTEARKIHNTAQDQLPPSRQMYTENSTFSPI